MLARPEKHRCIECARLYGTEDFALHKGQIENGPAYWCDRGLLCSPECSLAHHVRRMAEGTLLDRPASAPFETAPVYGR